MKEFFMDLTLYVNLFGNDILIIIADEYDQVNTNESYLLW